MSDRPNVRGQLRVLPCVLRARGDIEVVVTFHVSDIDQVLAVLKPRRRRQLSEQQRAAGAERLRAFRFRRFAAVQSDGMALESTNGGRNDAGAILPCPDAPAATKGAL